MTPRTSPSRCSPESLLPIKNFDFRSSLITWISQDNGERMLSTICEKKRVRNWFTKRFQRGRSRRVENIEPAIDGSVRTDQRLASQDYHFEALCPRFPKKSVA